MMEYKGYLGRVELDEDAGVFHGEVINTRDVITFEGKTVKELQKAFRDSVNDYLEFCKERGEEPDKPYSGQFVARVGPELHRKISQEAARAGKSLNAWVAERLEVGLQTSTTTKGESRAAATTTIPQALQERAKLQVEARRDTSIEGNVPKRKAPRRKKMMMFGAFTPELDTLYRNNKVRMEVHKDTNGKETGIPLFSLSAGKTKWVFVPDLNILADALSGRWMILPLVEKKKHSFGLLTPGNNPGDPESVRFGVLQNGALLSCLERAEELEVAVTAGLN